MKIWLLKPSEVKPIHNENTRLGRMGLMAEKLSERGHDVTWYTSTFSHEKKKQFYKKDTTVKVKENYQLEFIKTNSYKKNISIQRIISYRYMAYRFRKKAKKAQKPDIILVSFPTIELAREAILYGKKNKVPVVVDIRDLWPDIFNHNLKGLLKIIAQPYIYYMNYKTKKIMKQATALTAISPIVLEWAQKKGNRIGNKKDKYFYNGYKRQVEETKASERFCIKEDELAVCFTGSLVQQFNFDLLIETAKSMKKDSVKFYICGDGMLYKELENKTKDLPNIVMTGWLEKEDLDYVLSKSKIGFAPYNNTFDFQTGVSNKFSEYLSYGLPTIITSDGYMAQLLQKNECGIASRKPEKIREFILTLQIDDIKYRKMSENAKTLFEGNFMADQIYEEFINYLEEIKEEKL